MSGCASIKEDRKGERYKIRKRGEERERRNDEDRDWKYVALQNL